MYAKMSSYNSFMYDDLIPETFDISSSGDGWDGYDYIK